MKQPRCRIGLRVENGAQKFATRCSKKPGHNGPHSGPHLAELPYQKISWYQGDGRQFETDRNVVYAWRSK